MLIGTLYIFSQTSLFPSNFLVRCSLFREDEVKVKVKVKVEIKDKDEVKVEVKDEIEAGGLRSMARRREVLEEAEKITLSRHFTVSLKRKTKRPADVDFRRHQSLSCLDGRTSCRESPPSQKPNSPPAQDNQVPVLDTGSLLHSRSKGFEGFSGDPGSRMLIFIEADSCLPGNLEVKFSWIDLPRNKTDRRVAIRFKIPPIINFNCYCTTTL